jgi:predicted GIY-YIG superfamily endonuclease
MRDHFVYTAYDTFGAPLYVGCTGDPTGRYRAHMSGNSDARGWFDPYVVRWHVSGPYEKATARRLERERIAELEPIFNGHTPGNRDGRRVVNAYMARWGRPYIARRTRSGVAA